MNDEYRDLGHLLRPGARRSESPADSSRLLDKLEVDNRVQIALLVRAAGEH